MRAEEIPIGTRCFHAMFGWCTVTHPVAKEKDTDIEKTLVELECDEISYLVEGEYKTFKRDIETNRNVVYTPIDQLLKNNDEKLPPLLALKKSVYRPVITFWKKDA